MNIAHKLFKLALLIPILFWIYMAFYGDLGAEPAKELNHRMGFIALIYLVSNLWLGFFMAVLKPQNRYFRFFFVERRFLGVLTFVILMGHVFFYLALEGFEAQAFEQFFTKTYLMFGISAFTILFILAITSNNLAVRKLGRKWKKLHRLVYLAMALVTVHIFLIEKADLMLFAFITAPLWLAQIFRLVKSYGRK